jgi:hypothetical protein
MDRMLGSQHVFERLTISHFAADAVVVEFTLWKMAIIMKGMVIAVAIMRQGVVNAFQVSSTRFCEEDAPM